MIVILQLPEEKLELAPQAPIDAKVVVLATRPTNKLRASLLAKVIAIESDMLKQEFVQGPVYGWYLFDKEKPAVQPAGLDQDNLSYILTQFA